MKKSKFAAIAGIALLLALLPTGVSSADSYGACSQASGCLPDNGVHSYCSDRNYIDSWAIPFEDAMSNLDSQTDMSDARSSSCSDTTDVIWGLADLGAQVRGSEQCTNLKSNGRCEQAEIRLNERSGVLPNYTQRRKSACHEIGHSAGLAHSESSSDCMRSGQWNSVSYNTHHVNHINATF